MEGRNRQGLAEAEEFNSAARRSEPSESTLLATTSRGRSVPRSRRASRSSSSVIPSVASRTSRRGPPSSASPEPPGGPRSPRSPRAGRHPPVSTRMNSRPSHRAGSRRGRGSPRGPRARWPRLRPESRLTRLDFPTFWPSDHRHAGRAVLTAADDPSARPDAVHAAGWPPSIAPGRAGSCPGRRRRGRARAGWSRASSASRAAAPPLRPPPPGPFRPARRSARTPGAQTGRSSASASGNTTVPMSRPSITHPGAPSRRCADAEDGSNAGDAPTPETRTPRPVRRPERRRGRSDRRWRAPAGRSALGRSRCRRRASARAAPSAGSTLASRAQRRPGPVHQSGVDVGQPELGGQRLGQRALARTGRAVDGGDEAGLGMVPGDLLSIDPESIPRRHDPSPRWSRAVEGFTWNGVKRVARANPLVRVKTDVWEEVKPAATAVPWVEPDRPLEPDRPIQVADLVRVQRSVLRRAEASQQRPDRASSAPGAGTGYPSASNIRRTSRLRPSPITTLTADRPPDPLDAGDAQRAGPARPPA